MITLLTGENSFELRRVLDRLRAEFAGEAEHYEGEDLTAQQLPDLFMGQTLFSSQRLIVITQLSANSMVWGMLPDWIGRLSDDVHLVLVEPKLDKRTKTAKLLQKTAQVQTFTAWTERDESKAVQWTEAEVAARGMTMPRALVQLLVSRVGLNQWQLQQALEKLSVFDEVTEATIRDSIDARPTENVFELFAVALQGDSARVQSMIKTLSLSEEPHMLAGLLSGQAFQLAALAVARPGDDVARDIGAHPFVLQKLRSHATVRGVHGASRVVAALAQADEAMKTSSVDPWLAIERALLEVAGSK